MTTTAHEDQFIDAPEPVRQPYDTGSILRRNVADLEIALRKQTERAEQAEEKLTTARDDMQSWIDSRNGWMERAGAAEAELRKLREQKPVAYEDYWKSDGTGVVRRQQINGRPLYTAPVPAPDVPYGIDEETANRIALAVYDCENGIKSEPLLHAINHILMKEIHPLSQEGLAQMQPTHQPVGNPDTLTPHEVLEQAMAALEVALKQQTERAEKAERDFESLISDDNTIQEYAYELGGTDSGEYHLTAQDVARIAAKASEPYTSALRSLASYVGAGGYNADTVDAGVFEEKIRWGIGEIMKRMEKVEVELVKLRGQKPVRWHVRGNYFHDGDAAILFASMNAVHGANVEQLYAAPVPAPAVPTDEQIHTAYRNALGQSIRERDMPEIRKFAHALMQSAEVTK